MKTLLFILLTVFTATFTFSQTKNVVEEVMTFANHGTLVKALKAADLITMLKETGPFTILAPTDDAFKTLPVGALDNYLKAENQALLANMLSYHVLKGKYEASTIITALNSNNGSLPLKTINNSIIIASFENGRIKLTDEKGMSSFIKSANLKASNGIIHVIDRVLMPK
ncbi:MAG: fasciclin domain-containing protein [Saprospiraceae bacterium]|nr:fasciclin domain-containing protein [Saprospiraceae bacterium]